MLEVQEKVARIYATSPMRCTALHINTRVRKKIIKLKQYTLAHKTLTYGMDIVCASIIKKCYMYNIIWNTRHIEQKQQQQQHKLYKEKIYMYIQSYEALSSFSNSTSLKTFINYFSQTIIYMYPQCNWVPFY